MKQCSKCRQTFVLADFKRDRSRSDGFGPYCKSCRHLLDAASYAKNRETSLLKCAVRYALSDKQARIAKVKSRRQTPEGKASRLIETRLYRAKYAEKDKAHDAVKKALAAGVLVKEPCEVCGREDSQAHHDSYAEKDRLSVRWLCAPHHARLHRKYFPITRKTP